MSCDAMASTGDSGVELGAEDVGGVTVFGLLMEMVVSRLTDGEEVLRRTGCDDVPVCTCGAATVAGAAMVVVAGVCTVVVATVVP